MANLSPQEAKDAQFKKEVEILKRFLGGKKVEKDEIETVKAYASIGIIHLGFSFKRWEIQASLTRSGIAILGLLDTEKGREEYEKITRRHEEGWNKQYEKEKAFLKKFLEWGELESDEKERLGSWISTGLIRTKYNFSKRELQASLTDRGKIILNLAR